MCQYNKSQSGSLTRSGCCSAAVFWVSSAAETHPVFWSHYQTDQWYQTDRVWRPDSPAQGAYSLQTHDLELFAHNAHKWVIHVWAMALDSPRRSSSLSRTALVYCAACSINSAVSFTMSAAERKDLWGMSLSRERWVRSKVYYERLTFAHTLPQTEAFVLFFSRQTPLLKGNRRQRHQADWRRNALQRTVY